MSAPTRALKPWVRKAVMRTINRAPPPTIPKWSLLTGDTVFVMSGGGKGVTGVIKKVLRKQNRVIVAGANFVKRHVRPSAGSAGGVVPAESPIHVSRVALVDPVSGCVFFSRFVFRPPVRSPLCHPRLTPTPRAIFRSKPTRIGIKFTEEGARVRVAKRSGTVLPVPAALAKARRAARPVEPGPRDTPADLVARVTYNPPAALLPYLAAGGARSLFRLRGVKGIAGSGLGSEAAAAAEEAVPRKLRYVRMRAHHRKAIRGRWEREQAEARVVADAEAALRALAGSGGGGGGSGGGDGSSSGGSDRGGGEGDKLRAELR